MLRGDFEHRAQAMIRKFDPLRRVLAPGLVTRVADFVSFLAAAEIQLFPLRRKRSARLEQAFVEAVNSIVANLLAVTNRPDFCLAVPLSNDVHQGPVRYRPAAYGRAFQLLIGGVKRGAPGLLMQLEFVAVLTVGHNVRQYGHQQLTTVRPTAKFMAFFQQANDLVLSEESFISFDPPETVILQTRKHRSDRRAVLLDYEDTAQTLRWREEMKTINAMLNAAPLSLLSDDTVDEFGFVSHVGDRNLRRIFVDDWEKSGRLFGSAFWLNMPKSARKRLLRINAEPPAHNDVSAFNLRALYALAKRPFPFDASGVDPYVAGPGSRDGWKRVTNGLLNRTKPRNDWPARTGSDRLDIASHFPKGTKAVDVIDAVKTHHHLIVDWFERGVGLELMRQESDYIVAVLLSLIDQGQFCLPIHDCCVSSISSAPLVKNVMEQVSKTRFGQIFPVSIEL
jgi:hypothetical protein